MYRFFLFCLLTTILLMSVDCQQRNQEDPKAESEPLLLDEGEVEDRKAESEPLLLLDEGGGDESAASGGPEADNSRCHVCHINYALEELAVNHAKQNVGCEECHGSCDAHCADEDNITPPDIMFPRVKIIPACMECHTKETIDTEDHEAMFAGAEKAEVVCTDCHGEHRLAHRTRRWDKSTGKLLEDDKVRMLTDEMLGPQ